MIANCAGNCWLLFWAKNVSQSSRSTEVKSAMVFGSELRTIKLRGVGFVEGFGRWVWMELQLVTSLVQPCVRWFGIHGRKRPQNFLWDFKRNIEQHLTRHICVYPFYIFMLFNRKGLSTLKGGILFLILRNGLRRQIHTHFLYIFVWGILSLFLELHDIQSKLS